MMAFPLHVKLIGAEDGQRYALPDVGEEPEYAVPTSAFHAEEIIYKRLHLLAWTENGWEKRLDETSGMPLLTEKPVAGFRDRTNGIRCYGNLGVIANEAGMVATVFGDKPLQEESDSPKCCDVIGVPTPRSDGSDHSQERFCLR